MMRTEVQDLDRFREWPDDPTARPMGPLRFIERQIPVDGSSTNTKTVRILQVCIAKVCFSSSFFFHPF